MNERMVIKTAKSLNREKYMLDKLNKQIESLQEKETNLKKEFKEINPKKSATGIRKYTAKDIEQIKLVNHLVKEKALTLKGAKTRMKENPKKTTDVHEIVDRLKAVRAELAAIYDELNTTPPCGQPL